MPDRIYKNLGLSLRIPDDGLPAAFFVRVPPWIASAHRHPENCEAPLDLGYCCAMARTRGFHPVLLDLETGLARPADVIRAAAARKPRAVFISGITPAVPAMIDLAAAIRATLPDCLCVAVGQHADYSPETFLYRGSPFGLVAAGEFEQTVADILEAVAAASEIRVPGTLSFQRGAVAVNGERGLIDDLDSLGMPDHRFFMAPVYRYLHPMRTPARRHWGFIQGSRGCPHSCIYCSKTLRTSFGPRIRNRSPENIVEEMRWLKRHGVTTVVFTDDLFNSTKERVMELCDRILSSGVDMGWTAEGRVKPADVEMFRMMRRAGCSTFSMGVESGSPRILRTLQKNATVAEAEKAFAAAREAGLLRVAYFMVGSPGETRFDFEMTRALLRRLKPEMIQVANFTCYPGSQAYETYLKDRDIPYERFQHYEELINLSAEPDDVVRGWQNRLYMDLLTDTGFPVRYLAGQNLGFLMNLDRELSFALKAAKKLL